MDCNSARNLIPKARGNPGGSRECSWPANQSHEMGKGAKYPSNSLVAGWAMRDEPNVRVKVPNSTLTDYINGGAWTDSSSADLGSSSRYSSENLEGRCGEGFRDNCVW
ncbi:hypothetical protein ADUPG1_001768 [Aduncisulcus paluster]|uniref:Uncharacterized protein n=1 Tax=Aduncisulcus paluster TaxID=2918883 RepID=A0ABQ5KHI6_9EUKA|nr:hypothetical protein ADUPG1_001768 [Aduncisulcus paluster]